MSEALRFDVPGTYFRVIYLPANEPSPNCEARCEKRATVEFYDRRYAHTPDGQFTGGSYHAETLLYDWHTKKPGTGGLILQGHVPAWNVSGPSMNLVRSWIKTCESHKPISCEV